MSQSYPADVIPPVEAVDCTCSACSMALNCLCKNLDTGLRSRLENEVLRNRVVNRGQSLFEIGESFQRLYAVRSGSVKVYSLIDNGEEQVMGFYLPGELLGLEAIDRGVHECSAVALETSSICEVKFKKLEQLCVAQPILQQRLHRIYAREIARDYAMLQLLGRKSAEQRLANFLLHLSRRFADRGYSAEEFNLSMSRHDIGNYLGLALETVSRLLARFQDQELIEVKRRHVRLLKHQALAVLAGEPVNPVARRHYH